MSKENESSALPSLYQTVKDNNLLSHKGHSKSLGQNFLFDPQIIAKIVRVAGSLKGFDVLEIGPGPGGLTRAILEQMPDKLFAIEKDPNCVTALEKLTQVSQGKLQVIKEDAANIKPQSLSQNPLKIIANLPYNVGTNLLLFWLKDLSKIASLTLMFQKEVALRITANPSSKDYGRLTVLCQYLCNVERVFDLPPHVFKPAPKVFSSVVHFIPKPLTTEELALTPFLEKVTATGFGKRRKMIRASLKELFGEDALKNTLDSLGLPETERPENLTLANYVELAKKLKEINLAVYNKNF
ncbi:MAG: 16S rRNA (adenine(1518)-N(6)/adenine(1519)-N(6))-dimethyltransferase RsmA [Alphaproteobacteria bacterium]|nr:16S rRNA (adenine(1518)-N(6)/adenine(1519)-N(6))-dimethyltransferase RsmA [Alphaproteobacteria bacterium]